MPGHVGERRKWYGIFGGNLCYDLAAVSVPFPLERKKLVITVTNYFSVEPGGSNIFTESLPGEGVCRKIKHRLFQSFVLFRSFGQFFKPLMAKFCCPFCPPEFLSQQSAINSQ
jgi:hypothetical protein